MILLRSVTKQFRRQSRLILNEISVIFPPRAHVVILGPRGSGKTTLLRILCGLEQSTGGSIDRHISVSFPVGTPVRMPRKSRVRHLLEFAARVHSVDSKELTRFIIGSGRINPDLNRQIRELSGLESRRLNFLLGYALPFDYYLFDERISPGSKFDNDFFSNLFEQRSANAGTILATRSPRILRDYCDNNTLIYILFAGKLTFVPDMKEALRIFKALPEIDELGHGHSSILVDGNNVEEEED